MTAVELSEMRISRAQFGKLVGLCPMRITQLVQAGLVTVDSDGVRLIESLERLSGYRTARRMWRISVEEYLDRYIE